MDPVTLASLAMSAGQGIMGVMQSIQGAKLAKNNKRPVYEIPKGYEQNVRMYQAVAQGGIGEDAFSRANNKALQGLTASLQTGLITGADPNNVGDYYANYLGGMNDLFVKDAGLKLQNISNLAKARMDYAEQQQVEFGYNKDAPYKDKAQLASQLKTQGMQNMFGAANGAINAVGNGQTRKLYGDYMGAGTKVPTYKLPASNASQSGDINMGLLFQLLGQTG